MADSRRIVGLESDGSVPVTIVSGGGTGGTASAFGSPFPAQGTAAGFIDSGGNMAGGNLTASGALIVSATIDTSAIATSANQTNGNQIVKGNGTAGTASTGVLTVQGIASMTPVQVSQATAANLNATVTGTVAIASNSSVNVAQVGGNTTVTAGVTGTLAVGGSVATNVAIGTNPINNGAQAISSENTAVTATRMVQLVADLVGKQIVLPYANPENFIFGSNATASTGTTGVTIITGAGTGVRNYITQITVSNSHATVSTNVTVTDGATGATLWVGPAAAVYGGATATFPTPLRGSANTAIVATNSVTGASTITSMSGYKGV